MYGCVFIYLYGYIFYAYHHIASIYVYPCRHIMYILYIHVYIYGYIFMYLCEYIFYTYHDINLIFVYTSRHMMYILNIHVYLFSYVYMHVFSIHIIISNRYMCIHADI